MIRIASIAAALILGLAAAGTQAADEAKKAQGEKAQAAPAQPAANASRNSVGDEAKKEGSGSSQAQANPGRNSFTEGQAKSRIEDSGFQEVTGLQKDEQGIWSGQAMKDGKQVKVQLDFQGDVVVRQ